MEDNKDKSYVTAETASFILKVTPFVWWLNLLLFLLLCIFTILITFVLIKIGWFIVAIISLLFFVLYFYGLISMPSKIIVDEYSIIIVWPWKLFHMPKNMLRKVKIRKYRLRSVFILFEFQNGAFLNSFPIRFDWSYQSKDYDYELERLKGLIEGKEKD